MTHDLAVDPADEALALVADLGARGFLLEVEGERLHVSPARQLTDADRDALRRLKGAIIAALLDPGRTERGRSVPSVPTVPDAPPWDEAEADGVLADALGLLDGALARVANTEPRRRVLGVYRDLIRGHHEKHDGMLWQAVTGLEMLAARWRSEDAERDERKKQTEARALATKPGPRKRRKSSGRNRGGQG
jgi:hypothetical protein